MEADMWKSLHSYLRLVGAYMRINLNAQLEYRGAFISEAVGMLINDCFWVAFWLLFFDTFPAVNGWSFNDVLTLWAVSASGFGIAFAVMGNGWHLPGLIMNGQIDLWMLHPRAVLPHLLVGKTIASAWGDAVFGYLVYIAFVRPDFTHLALFTLLTLSVALLFVGFGVLSSSLTFYLGNGSLLAEQWRFATLTFATYPEPLFQGGVKFLLYTAIPAGFISYRPVAALRNLSLVDAGIAVLGSLLVTAIGVGVFYRGLRRYESGNLISMNG
jgi:ABC-2 type transport system permease protein